MEITRAIANQVAKIVPGATIYIENQEQGFDEPAFYIYEITATSKDNLMDYQQRKHLYCITWFPNSKSDDPGIREQCENMRSLLLDGFNFLDDLSLKLMDREAKIEDGVLIFTFKLQFRVKQQNEIANMQNLEQTGGLKHG